MLTIHTKRDSTERGRAEVLIARTTGFLLARATSEKRS